MKKLIVVILLLSMILSFSAPIYAEDEPELITTDFTVVGSVYDEDSGRYFMAVSFRNLAFSVSENESRWYYTTANVAFDLDSPRYEFTSDGSEKGNEALKALRDGEMIPFGTVIEITWSGMIAESYPPQLIGIVSFRFTDKQTGYSSEDIAAEAGAMNKMRTGNFYPLPEGAVSNPDDGVVIAPPTAASVQNEDLCIIPGEMEYVLPDDIIYPTYSKKFVVIYDERDDAGDCWLYLTDYDGSAKIFIRCTAFWVTAEWQSRDMVQKQHTV